jgi:hypothetical protein
MGTFSDRVRKMFNPNKQKQIDFNRQHGLNDGAKIISMDHMHAPHNAYFIRLTDNHNAFVKFKDGEYFIAENPEMAALFTLENGTNFINETKDQISNVELVRLDQLIKK